jgi:hypothetical protein
MAERYVLTVQIPIAEEYKRRGIMAISMNGEEVKYLESISEDGFVMENVTTTIVTMSWKVV